MRIKFLDSLRGLAILLVIFYHSYARWIDIVPYKAAYAGFPIFKFGWLGVQLFFLISGFVIFMTLDKTETLKSFIYKRWLRLFPAMLIASVLVFISASFFYERPAGLPKLITLLPGLTFIDPSWWSALLGQKVSSLEDAFWSLYIEFEFYVIAGSVYYFFGRKYLIPVIFLLFMSNVLVQVAAKIAPGDIILTLKQIFSLLSTRHFGWFAAGAMFYEYYQSRLNKHLYWALFIALLSAVTIKSQLNFSTIISSSVIVLIFTISIVSERFQRVLHNRALLVMGFISYPLYLIHENALISMIVKLSSVFPNLPSIAYPVFPFVILSTVAYIIAKYLEPWLRNAIKNKIDSKPYVSS